MENTTLRDKEVKVQILFLDAYANKSWESSEKNLFLKEQYILVLFCFLYEN
jgi:hypothetical protein